MEFRNRKFGALVSPVSPLDKPSRLILGSTKRNSYSKEYVNPLLDKSPTYDQLNTEMCVAFSLALTRWLIEYEQSDNREDFSPGMIYANRKNQDWQGEGMFLTEAMDNLLEYGVCFKKDFDIMGTYQACRRLYVKERSNLKPKAKPYRVTSWFRCNSDNDIKQAIQDIGFAEVSIPVFASFYYPDETGFVKMTNSAIFGYHAVVLAGWNERGWILKNSWGKNYGNNGVITLDYNYPLEEAYTYVDYIKEVGFDMLNNYTDGNDAAWARDILEAAVKQGIIRGYEEDDGTQTLRPNAPMTRAEVLAVLARLGILKVDKVEGDAVIK